MPRPITRLLQKFRNIHMGTRAFVIGNGPSLQRQDLSHLSGETTFGCNMVYRDKRLPHPLTYYTVSDPHIMERFHKDINTYRGPTRFFPRRFKQWVWPDHKTYFLPTENLTMKDWATRGKHFSEDASYIVRTGASVAYVMLELAVYMGCNPIYLLGLDCQSTGHSTSNYYPHSSNHFQGNPSVWPLVFSFMEIAKGVTDRRGIQVLNATAGGALDVFPRIPYNSLWKDGG